MTVGYLLACLPDVRTLHVEGGGVDEWYPRSQICVDFMNEPVRAWYVRHGILFVEV